MRRAPGTEGGYSMPQTAPLYDRPPVAYRDSRLMSIVLRTTPEVVKKFVPEPLLPNPDNLMLLNVNLLRSDLFGAYNEVVLTVPSNFGQTVGQYCIYLYVNNDAAIAAGREIWGFPKKQAQITLEDAPQLCTVTVERRGIALVRATLELTEPMTLEQLAHYRYSRWLNLATWFNLKRIPSVKQDAPPVVQQLTSTTMENLVFEQVCKGRATVAFGTSVADPLHEIAIDEVLDGFSIQANGILTYGDVMYDYLATSR